MVKAKKNLGQHFLTDLKIAKKVACLIEDKSFDLALEIGCGTGVLTDFLFELYPGKVISLDVDQESIEFMHQKYPHLVDVIQLQDFLDYPLDQGNKNQAIIGNFPYNISSQIVFKSIENTHLVKYFAGMFQKEVAERLCAEPGSKKYGILSVLLNTFYITNYCFSIKPGSFNPPPKVISGVIYAERKENFELPVPFKFYKTVIKTAFGQRRKMLRNSLSSLGIEKMEDKSYFTMRPEQLSFASFIELSMALYQIQNVN